MIKFSQYIVNEWKFNNNKKPSFYRPKNRESLKQLIKDRYLNSNKKYLDLRDIDVSNIKEMHGIFVECSQTETIDITGWNTSNVYTMEGMFEYKGNLKTIKGIEDLDVSNVTDMSYMFAYCYSLETIDLSKWKPEELSDVRCMFEECVNLKSIGNVDHWKEYTIVNMSFMFKNCDKLQKYPCWFKSLE